MVRQTLGVRLKFDSDAGGGRLDGRIAARARIGCHWARSGPFVEKRSILGRQVVSLRQFLNGAWGLGSSKDQEKREESRHGGACLCDERKQSKAKQYQLTSI